MPISFICTSCAKKLKVSDGSAGKRIRCPSCKAAVKVPGPEEFVEPDEEEENYGLDEEDSRRRDKPRKKNRDRDKVKLERRSYQPHRGGTVLRYGIMSLLAFCVFPAAWVMAWMAINAANEDLPRMREGRMDPAGMGLTKLGRILGIIGVVLSLVTVSIAITLKIMDKW